MKVKSDTLVSLASATTASFSAFLQVHRQEAFVHCIQSWNSHPHLHAYSTFPFCLDVHRSYSCQTLEGSFPCPRPSFTYHCILSAICCIKEQKCNICKHHLKAFVKWAVEEIRMDWYFIYFVFCFFFLTRHKSLKLLLRFIKTKTPCGSIYFIRVI